jgi:hypothetical protein
VLVGQLSGSVTVADRVLDSERLGGAWAAAFTAAGALAWVTGFRCDGVCATTSVGVGAQGEIYVAGRTSQAIQIGDVTLFQSGPGGFVARLTGQGAPVWAIGLAGDADLAIGSLVVTAAGPVVAGHFAGALAVGDTTLLGPGALHDAFVVALDPDGAVRWARAFGGASDDYAHDLAAAGATLLVAGGFAERIDLGTTSLASMVDSRDGFVAALADRDGETAWARALGGPGTDAAYAVASDGDGVAVAGTFDDVLLVGAVALDPFADPPSDDTDGFVLALDDDGTPRFAHRLGGRQADDVADLVMAGGAIWVGGSFAATAHVGAEDLASRGRHDAFVARYAASGQPGWARRLGGVDQDAAIALAATPDGELIVLGSFADTADLAGPDLRARGDLDLFVLALGR